MPRQDHGTGQKGYGRLNNGQNARDTCEGSPDPGEEQSVSPKARDDAFFGEPLQGLERSRSERSRNVSDSEDAWERVLESADIDFQPSEPRTDPDVPPGAVKLETRGTTQHFQGQFWRSQTIWKETIVAKLDANYREDLAERIRDCHTVDSWLVCKSCRRSSLVWNRCENFFCPECQPRLARERRESVEWWAKLAGQPKHVVLTVRNTEDLTRAHVQAIKDNFTRLRRTAFARNWVGGFYNLEVTNEGRGWHLHIHSLVDAKWIDAKNLAIIWGKLVGQDFAIVKVKDARAKDYLAEVTKYAVKGSQLASWTGKDIAAFIDAFTGLRTFGVFGSLYAKRTEWREWLDSIQAKGHQCECGGTHWELLSPEELAERELNHDVSPCQDAPRPPPQHHAEFAIIAALNFRDALSR